MNHQKDKNNLKATAGKRRLKIGRFKKFTVLMGLVVVMAVTAGALLYSGNRKDGVQKQADFEKLIGDWGRTDGDYSIRIHSITPQGQVQAAYFNPNPINIAQANASFANNTIQLFVELRDQGYPGSKYDLVYKPQEDILQGTYFQAQIQQFYDVVFQRIKRNIENLPFNKEKNDGKII